MARFIDGKVDQWRETKVPTILNTMRTSMFMLYDLFSNNYFHKSLVKITDILSPLSKPEQFQLSIMRSWMSPKTFFVLFFSVLIQQSMTKNTSQVGVTPIQMLGGNQQLVDRINNFASTIENRVTWCTNTSSKYLGNI